MSVRLTPRSEEVLSYFIGLAPVGETFELHYRVAAQDLGFRWVTALSHHISRLNRKGFIRRVGKRQGSTACFEVLKRGEDGRP